MNWAVIVLILIAAFGPLFWMLPSTRDRGLAKMRSRARVLGIQVEVTQLPDLEAAPADRVTAAGKRHEPMLSCAAYRLAMARPARAAPHWQLRRNTSETSGPLIGWQWDSPPVGDDAYWLQVKTAVDALPVDALGCGAQVTEVVCWWRERAPANAGESAVDSLHDALAKLVEVQRLADAANRLADGENEPDRKLPDNG